MVDECLIELLRKTEPGQSFPATNLYKEGWMLRLTLDWFSRNQVEHELAFNKDATWYSEGLLPTAFSGGGKLRETRTHADGVIGHITIEENTKSGLVLNEKASQFVVIEAKMFSGLSKGVKNAPYFDQAARTMACMAEVVKRAQICLSQFQNIAFYVVAPKSKKNNFSGLREKSHIQSTVKQRCEAYKGERDEWFADWFLPMFQKTETGVISWEDILAFISRENAADGKALTAFYDKCIKFNKKAA